MNAKTRKPLKVRVAILIARAYLLGALAISFTHIVDMARQLHVSGWQAWTTPAGIDGVAMLGLLARSEDFSARTRRTGLWVQVVASLLSLACNIGAGHTIGDRIYGAMIVVLYVWSEWFTGKLAPASDDVAAAEQAAVIEQAAAVQAKRAAAATKAAATRKANTTAAARTAADEAARRAARNESRRLARQVKNLENAYQAADAPVSPAA